MNAVTMLGFVAGGLTTLAFVPQVIKIWRSKSASDISWGMFLIFSAGVAFWLAYGIALDELPLIIANAVTLALAILILFLKWLYQNPAIKSASALPD